MDPVQADASGSGLRSLLAAMILWVAFFVMMLWDVLYIHSSLPVFQAMYEGLGGALPLATRFFLDGRTHLLAMFAIPILPLIAGVSWRLHRKAGLVVLAFAVLLGVGWLVAYRHAMALPIEDLSYAFDQVS